MSVPYIYAKHSQSLISPCPLCPLWFVFSIIVRKFYITGKKKPLQAPHDREKEKREFNHAFRLAIL
jgi:hypothetical protein